VCADAQGEAENQGEKAKQFHGFLSKNDVKNQILLLLLLELKGPWLERVWQIAAQNHDTSEM
jgi:hypothetical protein